MQSPRSTHHAVTSFPSQCLQRRAGAKAAMSRPCSITSPAVDEEDGQGHQGHSLGPFNASTLVRTCGRAEGERPNWNQLIQVHMEQNAVKQRISSNSSSAAEQH